MKYLNCDVKKNGRRYRFCMPGCGGACDNLIIV